MDLTRHGVTTARDCPQPEGKGPNGRPFCRWCHGEIPKGRRKTWCSQECVDEYRRRTDWGFIRSLVLKRDKGVCRLCGCDTLKIQRVFGHAQRTAQRHRFGLIHYEIMRDMGFNPPHHQDQWQADHIQPRVEGGSDDLSNLRTLCIPCHKVVTAELATKRAHQRKARKESHATLRP